METGESSLGRTSGWLQVRTNALICGACGLLVLGIWFATGWLQSFELYLGDQFTDQRGVGTVEESLMFVGIDDTSLDVLDILDEDEVLGNEQLDAMSFGYPFPRSVHAAMAQRLLDAGARLVVFDMVFSGEGEPAEDAALRAVIEAHPGRVVVGCNFTEGGSGGGFTSGITLPAVSILDSSDPMDPRVGLVNLFADSDGKVRSVTFAGSGDDRLPLRHSLAMAALKQLGKEHLIDDPVKLKHVRFPDLADGGWRYPPLPYYSIFFEPTWEKNYDGGEAFRDKIVFIGGSSIVEFHDVVAIPQQDDLLGAQFQMNVLAAALNRDFYESPSGWAQILSVMLMAAVAFGIAFVMRRPILGLAALVLCALAYVLVLRGIYFGASYLLLSATPLLTLGLAGISCFGTRFAIEQLEKARLRRTLERQVSKELADHIMSMPEDYFDSLPGVRKPVTVLFSDIRSFTSRSEKDDPVALVSQLKEYLDAMNEIVFAHGGVVDKFIGDAVMAVWGNVRSEGAEMDSRNAVAAAIAMQDRLTQLNEKWAAAGREGFKIGIGLNHGEAIFGMMGSEQKQEMTVIGDPVNQAARLEGLTKKFGMGIIVGPEVAEFVRGEFALRSLGNVRTMGKQESQELAAVLSAAGEAAQADWLRRFHKALEEFRSGELGLAREIFKECEGEQPEDLAVLMYLEAIERGDRDGVLVMSGK